MVRIASFPTCSTPFLISSFVERAVSAADTRKAPTMPRVQVQNFHLNGSRPLWKRWYFTVLFNYLSHALIHEDFDLQQNITVLFSLNTSPLFCLNQSRVRLPLNSSCPTFRVSSLFRTHRVTYSPHAMVTDARQASGMSAVTTANSSSSFWFFFCSRKKSMNRVKALAGTLLLRCVSLCHLWKVLTWWRLYFLVLQRTGASKQ